MINIDYRNMVLLNSYVTWYHLGVPWFLIHCFDSALLLSLLQFSILHPSPENIPLYSTNLTVENA